MTLSQRLSTTLVILATTMGATFTVLLAGGSGSLEVLPVRAIYDAIAAIALVPWLIVAVVRPDWRPVSRLAPAMVVCLAVFAISTVTSRVPRLSVEMLAYAVLLSELYLLLVALLRRPVLRLHFERLSLTISLIVCVLYLAQAFQAWLVWWDQVGRLAIPPLRPGYLGLSLGAPIPIATLVLLLGAFGLATSQLRGLTNRVVGAVVLGLTGATVLITASRGAWLGAAAGLAVTFGAAVVARPETRAAARRQLRSRWAAVALAVSVPILAIGTVLAALSGRLTLEDGGYRAGFAAASFRMFDASPITGAGPGTWQVLRAANSDRTSPDLYIPHAHNIYLQTLAEFGLLGLVAGVVLFGALALLILRAIRSDDSPTRRVAYAALFAVVLLAVQQVGDVLVNVPALLFAMVLPIAWLDAAAQPPLADRGDDRGAPDRPRQRTRALALGAAGLTCLILVGLARIESVTDVAGRGVAAADTGSWAEAAARFGEAAAADPGVAAYQFELGVSAANAGDLRLAEDSLAKSATADDYTYAWLNLAAVRWKLGDAAEARQALDRAERLGLQRTPVAVAAGWLHQQLGDDQVSLADYAIAIEQTPTLADDPFWSSAAGPPGGATAILDIFDRQAAPGSRLQVDLVLGRLDRAQADLATVRDADPALYGLILPAWSGDAVAWASLQAEATRRPLDADVVSWARFIASHRRDAGAVQRYGTWLTILNESDSGLPVVARIEVGSADPLPPYVLDRYGSLYRRSVPAAQIVSLLPQVVLGDRP
jgi:O-antigen ligase